MATTDLDDDRFVDPDELKMPENPHHRRVIELVASLAAYLLGSKALVYRDMNWYPPDGGNAVAPDIMVLPPRARPHVLRSYRQPDLQLPSPLAVVEIPSTSDSWLTFNLKLKRYQDLGVMVYVIDIEEGVAGLSRMAPNDETLVRWPADPLPELGGLSIAYLDGEIVASSPSGLSAENPEQLMAALDERADRAVAQALDAAAKAEAATAEVEAVTAEVETANERIRALESRLRELGEPPTR